jgi:hypothetical protein
MLVKWIKRLIWLILFAIVWKHKGIGISILFLLLVIILDFLALFLTGKLAIKGYQEGDSPEDIQKAKDCFFQYQQNPMFPSKPLVTFSMTILAPLCSIIIPFIIASIFLGWF